ncbi:Acetylglucosaminyltransferase EXT1/exostosin 1 [Handroanthus impetiginosus]|uniref:Acetylglucosaminyltransferase EXT1/exostosin 1 n=1 Tax=Handroanthus impetiginosus TaxID=429701 RepID=A0A2G9IA99_9LAMI|nr:Acetylglucosaminyltransferase EXT1/exostosin 1 [Handroanthus impetiginosus]
MPSPLTPILLLLLLTTTATAATSQDSDLESDCTNRWIHIRHLPPEFNLDLLTNCSEYPLFDNFCPYISNHGLGQKTHNSSHSWYRTDPFMLELIFHRRMFEYPCLTSDPDLADAVYIPYYAGIDSLKYLFGPEVNSSFRHGLDFFHYLAHLDTPSIWNKNLGHDHFLVMARPAWDFSQPLSNDPPIFGTSFLELPEFYNVTALTFEARAYPWQEQAIPYPTSFHPPNLAFFESWLNRVRKSRRSTLMLFAGGGGISANPNVRRSIRLECDNVTNMNTNGTGYSKFCEFLDCSNGVCEHDPIKFMKPMLQSSFCLQPPGDTPTSRSTFDGILAGCIPVFFEELSVKRQYGWHLPESEYDEFSVFIQKEDVVFKGVRILDVLMSIPRSEVRRKREKVLEMIGRVMYRKHGSSLGLRSKKDAFDIAIEVTLQRIKSRKQQLADQR